MLCFYQYSISRTGPQCWIPLRIFSDLYLGMALKCLPTQNKRLKMSQAATQFPDFPPRFSNTLTPPITIPLSTALHIS